MNCADFESILADYLDGTLPDGEVATLEHHAAICSGCSELLREARFGLGLLKRAEAIEPPVELITRIAYLAPAGKSHEPFERQSLVSRLTSKWLRPVLQPRLAMGMAMTILSFAMLKQCTGIEVKQIQPADLSPVRVWGGLEDKALRVRDQAVKYYENLRVVYEVETHLKDLQTDDANAPAGAKNTPKASAGDKGKALPAQNQDDGRGRSANGSKP